MYYLRKEPYETIIPEIKKTNGEVIPKRKHMVEDRALYKHNQYSRYYRQTYTGDKGSGCRLYKVKRLSTILRMRERLHEYCGEWFDVYDENGKVEIEGTGQVGS